MTTGPDLLSAFAALLGYLLGSIPFGLVLTRAAGLGDIRSIGSGNIGATNVLRTGNKGLAAATLAGDLLKGTAAVLAGRYLAGETGALLGGVAAYLGHLFPLWLGFKGGKGVATYIGVALGLAWLIALVFAATWLITAYLFRYSSLSALTASVVTPVAALLLSGPALASMLAMLSALLIWKHRANIERLRRGAEPRIGDKS
jgi:glycerol-3-phosphate acyltransferase PlsY